RAVAARGDEKPRRAGTVEAPMTAERLPPMLNPEGLPDLEDRVQLLEDAVASLCDSSTLEERIAERVAVRLTQHDLLLPPVATSGSSSATQTVARPAPLATFAENPVPAPSARSVLTLAGWFQGWLSEHSLLRDLWWDVRMFWRMIRDPGYMTSWAFKFGPLAILIYVFILPKVAQYVSWLLPSVQLGIVGTLLDVLLLYVGFKIVHRELRRYHDFLTRFRA
ncbi:MAG TPA: hypothetical protein PKC45_15510, partial [Gemmatales bacterium]|nr:hypothetical protein [Gemmatales bacterium]